MDKDKTKDKEDEKEVVTTEPEKDKDATDFVDEEDDVKDDAETPSTDKKEKDLKPKPVQVMDSYDAKKDEESDDAEDEKDDVDDKGEKEKDDKEDDAEKVKTKKELNESVKATFQSFGLTDETLEKVSVIVESVSNTLAKEKIKLIEENANAQLEQSISEYKALLCERANDYLTEEVEKWREENKVAIQESSKVVIADKFLRNLKSLIESYNLEINLDSDAIFKEKEDAITKLTESVQTLEAEKLQLSDELISLKKEKIFNESTKGMTAVSVDRLKLISEDILASDEDEYLKKLTILKENVINVSPNKNEDAHQNNTKTVNPHSAFADKIKQLNKNKVI